MIRTHQDVLSAFISLPFYHPLHSLHRGKEGEKAKGAIRFHSEKHACPRKGDTRDHRECRQAEILPAINPRETAKRSGTPNSLIVTCPDVSERALRASRSPH